MGHLQSLFATGQLGGQAPSTDQQPGTHTLMAPKMIAALGKVKLEDTKGLIPDADFSPTKNLPTLIKGSGENAIQKAGAETGGKYIESMMKGGGGGGETSSAPPASASSSSGSTSNAAPVSSGGGGGTNNSAPVSSGGGGGGGGGGNTGGGGAVTDQLKTQLTETLAGLRGDLSAHMVQAPPIELPMAAAVAPNAEVNIAPAQQAPIIGDDGIPMPQSGGFGR